MKIKSVRNGLRAIVAAICLATFIGKAVAQDTVVISTGEWAPFTSESMENNGVGLHIITAAFAQVGLNVEYQWLPWTRAMEDAEQSKVDFSGIWFYNDERAQKFSYTVPVVGSSNVFFKRSDSDFDWSDFDSFPQDKVVGRTHTYSYGQYFDEAVADGKIQVDDAPNDILNFRKLIRGRIDAFAISELVGYDMLRQQFKPEEVAMLEAHPIKISTAPLHLIAAKGNTRAAGLIEQFNEGMAQLESSGELEAILDSYK